MRPEQSRDPGFELFSRQTPSIQVFFAAPLYQPMRDVISHPQALAGFAVGRCEPVAGLIKELTTEKRTLFCSGLRSGSGSPILELFLDALPPVGIDDGVMLAFVDRFAMAYPTCVNRIGENVMDMPSVKRTAAGHFASRGLTPTCAQVKPARFLFDTSNCSALFIKIKEGLYPRLPCHSPHRSCG